jgi:hypothetical protein
MLSSRLDPIFRAGSRVIIFFCSIRWGKPLRRSPRIYANLVSDSARRGSLQRKKLAESALFLDGDGLINVDRGDIHRPDQFVPGIFHLAHFWASELQRLIVVGILEFRRFNA